MKQIFTQEEVKFIRGVAMRLIDGEEVSKDEMDKITELSERLAEEQRKEAGV